jgi:hypothetical protein
VYASTRKKRLTIDSQILKEAEAIAPGIFKIELGG